MRNIRHLRAVALYFAALTGWAAAQSIPARGQAPPSPTDLRQVPAAGLENPWDVRKIIADLQNDTNNLGPLLHQINPQEWYDKKGAPSTYIVQWQSAQQRLNDVLSATKLFSQKT